MCEVWDGRIDREEKGEGERMEDRESDGWDGMRVVMGWGDGLG